MSLFKPRPEEIVESYAPTSFCMFCRGHIETPLGQADLWNHWLDDHRDALLSSHGREVISRQPAR